MSEADKAFCNRYTGSKGGKEATKLSIYPFMKEISEELVEAAILQLLWKHHDLLIDYKKFVGIRLNSDDMEDSIDHLVIEEQGHGKAVKDTTNTVSTQNDGDKNEAKNGSNNHNKYRVLNRRDRQRVTIFSGHDTVIAPVLASMGLYKDHDCVWPPYASRISFELYQLNNHLTLHNILKTIRSKHASPDGSESSYQEELSRVKKLLLNVHSDSTQIERDTLSLSFVRVLFNGRDMTGQIPACQGRVPCPLSAFKEMVDGLIRPAVTLEEGCNV
jgi:hypothetical protein